MYQYNFLKNRLWITDITLTNNELININPYLLNKIVRNEFKKVNNNKYFFLLDFSSIFITFKLNNILLINNDNSKKLEHSHFLIVYLLKYTSFYSENNYDMIKIILKKILFFLKPYKFIASHKRESKNQSYNFCKYSYKCKCFYKNKKCKFDHYCYYKICIDIKNLHDNLYNLSKENIKKYIVTIHFVVDHIYDEYFMYRYINDIN